LAVVATDPQIGGTFTFFRYFGDMDGDRDVDFYDFFAFQRTNGRKEGEAGFISALDFDGDGAITSADLDAYRAHHLTALPAPVAPVASAVRTQGRISPIGSTEQVIVKPDDEHSRTVITARAARPKVP
jgi:hypothetical protein